jgi:hypothetical protein
MASTAGTDLHGRHTFLPNAFRVIFCFEIAFDNSEFEFVTKGIGRRFEQSRLARPGGRHEVYGQRVVSREMLAIMSRLVVICIQQALEDLD